MVRKSLHRSLRPEAVNDVKNLASENLKRRAIQILVDVSRGEVKGKPLMDHPSVGDLSDCRKVYFDDQDGGKPRFRLVYRLLPNEVEAVEVEAVAVGLRRLRRSMSRQRVASADLSTIRRVWDNRSEADYAAAAEWAETSLPDLADQTKNSGDASRAAARAMLDRELEADAPRTPRWKLTHGP